MAAFFLNAAEAVGTLVAVVAGASGFTTLANNQPDAASDSAAPFATAIAVLLFVLALEWERRRYQTALGAATVFQRLHTFGIAAEAAQLSAPQPRTPKHTETHRNTPKHTETHRNTNGRKCDTAVALQPIFVSAL